MRPFRKPLLAGCAVVGLLLVAAAILTPRITWDGQAAREVRVVVSDPEGRPIAGAQVALVYPAADGQRVARAGATGADGVWRCDWAFGASGESVLLWRTGTWGVSGYSLRLTAAGHRPCTAALVDLAGRRTFPLRQHSLTVSQSLQRE